MNFVRINIISCVVFLTLEIMCSIDASTVAQVKLYTPSENSFVHAFFPHGLKRKNFEGLRVQVLYDGPKGDSYTFMGSNDAIQRYPPHKDNMSASRLLHSHILAYAMDFFNFTFSITAHDSDETDTYYTNLNSSFRVPIDLVFGDFGFYETTTIKNTFIMPITQTRAFIYVNAEAQYSVSGLLNQAFSPNVWIVLFSTCFVLFISLTLFWKSEFDTTVSWIMASLSLQGWDMQVTRGWSSVQILTIFFHMSVMVLHSFFGANLLGWLKFVQLNIKDIDDIALNGFSVGIATGSFLDPRNNLKNLTLTPGTSSFKVNQNLDSVYPFIGAREAGEHIIGRKNYAFISQWDVYEYIDGSAVEKCKLISQIPFHAYLHAGAFAVKGSPFINPMNYVLTKMRDSGVFRRNSLRRERRKSDYYPSCSPPTHQALSLISLKLPFYCLGLACLTVPLIFTIELVVSCLKRE